MPNSVGRSAATQRVVIVTAQDIALSWEWLVATLSKRGHLIQGDCVFDPKMWAIQNKTGPLLPDPISVEHLSRLYLASQFGDAGELNNMANGGPSVSIAVTPPVDPQIKKLLNKEDRMRASLAEHLAYWVRAADAASAKTEPFALAQPNQLPEDKGHDGLWMKGGASPSMEVQSVKNASKSPRTLVASAAFRKKAKASEKHQLDDFWLLTHERVGMLRLHRMLAQVATSLQLSPGQEIKDGIVADCAYNAIVVADQKYAKPALFDGFRHVIPEPHRRVATYVGAAKWVAFAAAVTGRILALLAGRGLT